MDRVFVVRSGLGAPLVHVRTLPGEAGRGPGPVPCLPFDAGVIVCRRGAVSLHEHDLSKEVWRIDTGSAPAPHVVLVDGKCWFNPGNDVMALDPASGTVQATAHLGFEGTIAGASERSLLVLGADHEGMFMRAVSRSSLSVMWQRRGLVFSCTSGRDAYLVQGLTNAVVECIDEVTGESRWTVDMERLGTKPKKGAFAEQRIHGASSLAVVGDSVVAVLRTGGVRILDIGTGELLARGETGVIGGGHLVTERSVFFLQRHSMREFDRGSFREVSRLDFRDEMLARSNAHDFAPPTNFWLTKNAVVFGTMGGGLFLVTRSARAGGAPEVWSEYGHCVPMGESPVAWGDYVYVPDKGKLALRCYRTEGGAKDGEEGGRRKGVARPRRSGKSRSRRAAHARGWHSGNESQRGERGDATGSLDRGSRPEADGSAFEW